MTLSKDAKPDTFINVFTVEPLQRMIETVPQTSRKFSPRKCQTPDVTVDPCRGLNAR